MGAPRRHSVGVDDPDASSGAKPPAERLPSAVERFVTLSVETPAQWAALRAVAPLDAFDHDRFASLAEADAICQSLAFRLARMNSRSARSLKSCRLAPS